MHWKTNSKYLILALGLVLFQTVGNANIGANTEPFFSIAQDGTRVSGQTPKIHFTFGLQCEPQWRDITPVSNGDVRSHFRHPLVTINGFILDASNQRDCYARTLLHIFGKIGRPDLHVSSDRNWLTSRKDIRNILNIPILSFQIGIIGPHKISYGIASFINKLRRLDWVAHQGNWPWLNLGYKPHSGNNACCRRFAEIPKSFSRCKFPVVIIGLWQIDRNEFKRYPWPKFFPVKILSNPSSRHRNNYRQESDTGRNCGYSNNTFLKPIPLAGFFNAINGSVSHSVLRFKIFLRRYRSSLPISVLFLTFPTDVLADLCFAELIFSFAAPSPKYLHLSDSKRRIKLMLLFMAGLLFFAISILIVVLSFGVIR